ncbi:hypothetical protein Q2K19_16255 [Micromonospora soli]|uniref:hypothetical protein n=1 Tax=Micromonospora sp. NBRC 110009 TaxID=3061627 RepID=UPI0026723593|nr:hypothetical protein [Micromonospora sp. NBRC 110009]WKU01912.1 hypothetical protein Q2K19_16255 [Micromonospora sp. NBRC 110009]
MLAGLGWAGAVGATKWHLHAKAERLRAEGVPERATVGDRRNTVGRGGGTDTVQVWYTHGGSTYSTRIPCGSARGCMAEPPAEMTVWVDPARPAEFVAENGHTDDSLRISNAWAGLPFGLVVAALGAWLTVPVTRPAGPATRRLPVRRGPGPDRLRRGGRSRVRQRRRRARR